MLVTLARLVVLGNLELVHTDIWGLAPISSSVGFTYYVHFTNVYFGFSWFYLLRKKSDVMQAFINLKNHVELQLNTKIKSM